MSRKLIAIGGALVLTITGVAHAAGPVVLASPGASPFAACTADNVAGQIAAFGSTLYPGSEIEPRSARYGSTIVGEYQQDRWSDGGSRGLVTSVSHDDGATWKRVVVPGLTKCSGGRYDRASDPWVSFAPNGDLYAIALAFGFFDPHNAIIVSKSTDLGETWSAPVEVAADDTGALDKESITADPNDPNFVYATWDRFVTPGGSTHAADQGMIHSRSFKQQTFFARSTDGGLTWSTPQAILVENSFFGTIGGMIRVLADGTLLDGLTSFGKQDWTGGPCASIAMSRSSDHGAHWSMKPTIIAPLSCTYGGAHDPDTGDPVRSGLLGDFAGDGNNAYAVWEDARASAPTTGRILFSQSTDGGRSWSAPSVISATPAGVDAFVPTIAVNSAHAVGVSYYDFRRNTPGGAADTDLWLTTCASSCTNAASWVESHAAGPFDMHQAPVAGGEFVGDYEGMTTNGTAFEPFFIQADSAPGNPTDAFFTTIGA